MDKNALRRLAGIDTLTEKKWSGEVKAKEHPPEGLFADGSATEIAAWLKSAHDDFKGAMSALNFYINRAGEGLTAERKAELESAKGALRKVFGVSESVLDLAYMRKIAGLPVAEAETEEDAEEGEEKEEKEEEIPDTPEASEEDDEAEKEEGAAEEKEKEEGPEDHEESLKAIAAAAEGKTGDELLDLIKKVYQAGVDDGCAQAKPAVEEQKACDEE